LAIAPQIEGMTATKYQSNQLTSKQIETRLRDKLGDVVVDCVLASCLTEELAILYRYLEGGSDTVALGLVQGRYQYLQLQISLHGKSETLKITSRNADGSLSSDILVERANGQVATLESFMVANKIASVPALLAMN